MADASLRTNAAWRVLDGFGGSMRSLSRSVSPGSEDEMAAVFAAADEAGIAVVGRERPA